MMKYSEKIKAIAQGQSGTVLSSDVYEQGIARIYLSRMVEAGTLQRVGAGVYVLPDFLEDEMFILQRKYPAAIFSHETALFLHECSDRAPFMHSITVPSGYKVTRSLAEKSKVYYIRNEFHSLGLIEGNSAMGNSIHLYDVERSLCDLIRSKNRIDIQVFSDALKQITKRYTLDSMRLFDYARALKVEKILHTYLEVLI